MNIIHGDCLEELKKLEDNSVDAVVTDPPYGLSNTKPQQVADVLKAWVTGDAEAAPTTKGGFMNASWDSFVPPPAVWEECMRVLKPGGHMAVFAGARTQDLMGLSIRLAGFEIRDTLGWVYGSGFPKSLDISKAVDKSRNSNRERQYEFTEWMRSTGITAREINEATGTSQESGHLLAGPNHSQPHIATADLFDKLRPLLPEVPERIERLVAERTGIEWSDYVKREVVGKNKWTNSANHFVPGEDHTARVHVDITAPASDAAKQWDGWGTALKPAIEPIILARKPLVGTVAANVLAHGVGGINIDACRIETTETLGRAKAGWGSKAVGADDYGRFNSLGITKEGGRWPANVLLDEHAAAEMDEQSGPAGAHGVGRGERTDTGVTGWSSGNRETHYNDSGGASRFFPVFKYQAKAPKKERPVIEREDGTKIQHPTVKPLTLLEWLVELITPPGGVVLDPFAGSGTTLQAAINKGFTPIGIEQDADYIKLIEKRLEATCTTHKN